MILESCQLLSTAHRILDGIETPSQSDSGRSVKRWVLSDSRDTILYSATHVNHPSAIWARRCHENYMWLAQLNKALCVEYTYRYDKIHKCESDGLVDYLLNNYPKNMPQRPFTQPTPAMLDIYKVGNDSIQSYRKYYNQGKTHLAQWTKRQIPEWYVGA